MRLVTLMTAVFVCCAFILQVEIAAARRFGRRTDLENLPPLFQSGYVVPLDGSETCYSDACVTSLPPPSPGKTLQYLALARGINTYSCINQQSYMPPLFESQDTTLWNVAPLLSKIPNEQAFHSLPPQMLEFDYAALRNSSLQCMGSIVSNRSEDLVRVFNDVFVVNVQNLVNSPLDPQFNLDWALSTSDDLGWNLYRVETAGGTPPPTCDGIDNDIQLDYAAEYWFYH